MIKALLTISNGSNWQDLFADGVYCARVWGQPQVVPSDNGKGFHVTIRDSGSIIAFFNVREVEYAPAS